MASARREFEGESVAFLARMIPVGVWAPAELVKIRDLNPFKERVPDSPAMAAHKAKIAAMRFKAAAGGE